MVPTRSRLSPGEAPSCTAGCSRSDNLTWRGCHPPALLLHLLRNAPAELDWSLPVTDHLVEDVLPVRDLGGALEVWAGWWK